MAAQRWQPGHLPPIAVRGPMPVTERNVVETAQRFGPETALKLAVRAFDFGQPEAARQAVWSSWKTPMSAEDAALEHDVSGQWVLAQLAKRSAYLARIGKMLGFSPARSESIAESDLVPAPAGPSVTRQPAAVRSGSPFGTDWTKRGGSLDRGDGTGTARVKKTAVQPELRRRAEAAARTAADELGVIVPMVKFYSDRGSAVRADANGLYQSATPTTVWIAADIPSVLSLPIVVRHEVAHYAQAMRGRPIDEPEATAFARGSKAARVALGG